MNTPPFKQKFADSSPAKVHQLTELVKNDIDTTSHQRRRPFCLKSLYLYSALLPCLKLVNEEFKHFYNLIVLDLDVKDDLQRSKVINWCRTSKKLCPIKTRGDGNCLLHAVSLFLWGVEDRDLLLRRLLYLTLANDPKNMYRTRWLMQYRNTVLDSPDLQLSLDSKDMDAEWESILRSTEDNPTDGSNYPSLEGIHLYVLANILRRPIIVLADRKARSVYGQSMQKDSIGGIYLPLEWKPTEISKSPITIAYSMNHFSPLLPQRNVHDGRATDSEYVIPLVYHDFEPIALRFMLYAEEALGHDLINGYLETKNIPMTTSDSILEIPVAKSNYRIIKPALDIVQSHFEECQQIYQMWIRGVPVSRENHPTPVVTSQQNSVAHPPAHQQSAKCPTPGCDLFGSPDYGGKCSDCFNKYTVEYSRQETERRNQMFVEPSAPLASMPYLPSIHHCELSIMDENCQNFAKCGNRMSVHTYPFCHECQPETSATRQSIGQEESSSPPTAVRNEPVDDSGLFGEGEVLRPLRLSTIEPATIGSNSSPRAAKCLSPSCENVGHPNYNNFCKHCYSKLQTRTPLANTPEGPSSQTFLVNGESSSSRGTPSPGTSFIKPFEVVGNQLTMEQINQVGKCKFEGCQNYGYCNNNGLCEACFNRTKPSEVAMETQPTPQKAPTNSLKRLCSVPGCKEEKLKNEQGFCLQCYIKSELPSERVSREPIPPPDNSTLESKTPLETSELPQPCIVTSSKDKVKCAASLCGARIYPPNQLCERCKGILEREYAAESNRSRSLEVNRYRPARQGNAYSPSRRKCQTENCEFYGDKKYHGYCSNCFQVATSTAPVRSAPSVVAPRQNNTAPHARQSLNCVEPGCDKFGDPSMSYRCTEHYRRAMQRAPPPHSSPYPLPAEVERYNVAEKDRVAAAAVPLPPQNYNIPVSTAAYNIPVSAAATPQHGGSQYIQTMQKVEGSRKGNKCKTSNCDNYGNPSSQGYCNACYKSRTSGGNDPRQGRYMCC
ncbi:tumor necrosis factor alpha-induced protein 3-like isoform X3 [Crassostrea virginica]